MTIVLLSTLPSLVLAGGEAKPLPPDVVKA
jgi:hypothetical protein